MAPVWQQLNQRVMNHQNLRIAMVDCTNNAELCMNQQINAYPTLVLFKSGTRLTEYNGARDLDSLHSFVASYLEHDDL